jgi:hypothetical protein
MEEIAGDRQAEAILLALLGSLVAMQGEFERARRLVTDARSMLEELSLPVRVAYVGIEAWRIEMLAGDAVAAEFELRRSYDILVDVGEKYLLSTVAGLLAQTLYILGRLDEVNPSAVLQRSLRRRTTWTTKAWRCVRAAACQEGTSTAVRPRARRARDPRADGRDS